MMPVLASLLALGAGPLLLGLARGHRWVLGAVDGFVVVTIGGIVALHILPHAFLVGGWPMLLVAALGLFGPALLERGVGKRLAGASRWMLPAALLGLSLHAFIDGAVLVDHHDGHGHEGEAEAGVMALGVVLHRVPEGLAIWWVFRQRHGLRGALLALAGIAAATTLGFFVGEHAEGMMRWLHVLQALVAGSLLHVIFHRSHDLSPTTEEPGASAHACELDYPSPAPHGHGHDHGHDHGPPIVVHDEGGGGLFRQTPAALGALLGVVLLWGVSLAHPDAHRIANEIDMGATFVTLALESAPALLLSYGVAAMLHAFWPGGAARWLSRGGALVQSLKALLLGPLVPVCSCGVLPLYSTMIARGVPAPAAMTLMVAAPGMGVGALLLSLSLLGPRLSLARAALVLLLALLVGLLLGARAGRASGAADEPAPAAEPPAHRLREGLAYAATSVIDRTLPWVLLGLGVASFLEPSLGQDALAHAPRLAHTTLVALLGLPLYLCATAATPLAAILMHKGLSVGASLALLLVGPTANLMTFRMLAQLHGRRVAVAFGLALLLGAIGLGTAADLALGPVEPVELHSAASSQPEPFNQLCLVVLVVLGLASLARRGPRYWVEQIFATEHQHA